MVAGEEFELLDKLLGQWISSTLGLVQVRRQDRSWK